MTWLKFKEPGCKGWKFHIADGKLNSPSNNISVSHLDIKFTATNCIFTSLPWKLRIYVFYRASAWYSWRSLHQVVLMVKFLCFCQHCEANACSFIYKLSRVNLYCIVWCKRRNKEARKRRRKSRMGHARDAFSPQVV